MSSSSEITIEEWGLGGRTEETEAAGVTEGTEAAGVTEAGGMTEGTGATGVTEATDAVGARAAGGGTMADRVAAADALRRSNSMKCVYDVRTKGKSYICLIQLYYNSEEKKYLFNPVI